MSVDIDPTERRKLRRRTEPKGETSSERMGFKERDIRGIKRGSALPYTSSFEGLPRSTEPEIVIRDLAVDMPVGQVPPGEDWNRAGRFDVKGGQCEKLLKMIFRSRDYEEVTTRRCIVAIQNKLPEAQKICNEANLVAERRDREEKVYNRKCIPVTGNLPPPRTPPRTLQETLRTGKVASTASSAELREAQAYLADLAEKRRDESLGRSPPRVFRKGESMY